MAPHEQGRLNSGFEASKGVEQRTDAVDVLVLETPIGEQEISYIDHLRNLVMLDGTIQKAITSYYESQEFQYVRVPQIVGVTGACENVQTLFGVKSRNEIPLFFTQTGQLHLEQVLQAFRGKSVYTIIHSGRDEEHEDERHLLEFPLAEEETSCQQAGMTRENYNEEDMFEMLLQHIEAPVKHMIQVAIDAHGGQLATAYGRDVTALEEAVAHRFLRVSYDEAIVFLNEQGYAVGWGEDLNAEHEQVVLQRANEKNRLAVGDAAPQNDIPMFITRYPKDIKFFNMKVSETDDRVVLSADLILPISGESAGSAVREHDGAKLRERLLGSRMFELHQERGGSLAEFEWYLKIIDEQRTDPHAGYGIGLNRVMQYILGQPDIRMCSVLSMLSRQTRDWDPPQGIVFQA